LEKNRKSFNEYQLNDFLRYFFIKRPENNPENNISRFLKTSMFKMKREWNANSALRKAEKNTIVRLCDEEKRSL